MKFDPEKLRVGDVFYYVKERNQAFHRKKIHRVIDGEDWFRYDRPLGTYEIVTYKVLGILRKELEGDWEDLDSLDLQTEFFVRYQDETHAGVCEMDFYDKNKKYFLDKHVASLYKSELEAEAKELDKK